MSTATEPAGYTFVIDCALRVTGGEYDDDHAHDGPCDYRWMCGTCLTVLDEGQACPEHTPMEFPGLRLIDCDATPRHITFMHTDDGYGVPCPWCQWHEAEQRHRDCGHSHHARWRSWKLTGLIDHWGARAGLWAGFGSYSHGGGCKGCRTGFRWSPRWSYLFVTMHTWTRLGHIVRHGHRWGRSCHGCDGMGVCNRCDPCTLDDCPFSPARAA